MEKQIKTVSEAMDSLAEDARNLVAATANVAGERVGDARRRLTAALERGKEACGRAQRKAVESAEAADEMVHMHPYQAIAIGIGVGALVGYFATSKPLRRKRKNR